MADIVGFRMRKQAPIEHYSFLADLIVFARQYFFACETPLFLRFIANFPNLPPVLGVEFVDLKGLSWMLSKNEKFPTCVLLTGPKESRKAIIFIHPSIIHCCVLHFSFLLHEGSILNPTLRIYSEHMWLYEPQFIHPNRGELLFCHCGEKAQVYVSEPAPFASELLSRMQNYSIPLVINYVTSEPQGVRGGKFGHIVRVKQQEDGIIYNAYMPPYRLEKL